MWPWALKIRRIFLLVLKPLSSAFGSIWKKLINFEELCTNQMHYAVFWWNLRHFAGFYCPLQWPSDSMFSLLQITIVLWPKVHSVFLCIFCYIENCNAYRWIEKRIFNHSIEWKPFHLHMSDHKQQPGDWYQILIIPYKPKVNINSTIWK